MKINRLGYGAAFAAVAAIGVLYGFGGMAMSNLGMDWGYYLVDKMWHQANGNMQWWGAVVLGTFIAPAIYGAMAVALAKRVLGGKRIWYGVLALPVMYGIYVLCTDSGPAEWGAGAAALAGWTALLVTCYRSFDWLVTELSKRCNAVRLMLCSTFVLAPVAVLSVAKIFAVDGSGDSDAALVSAVLRYFAVLFVAAVAVPYAVRTRAQSAAAAASVFAFLPTLLFSIINVGFATLFLHDPHAMLSSVLILLATIGATAGGAVLGTWRPGRS